MALPEEGVMQAVRLRERAGVLQGAEHGEDVAGVAGVDVADEWDAVRFGGDEKAAGGGNVAIAIVRGHLESEGDDEAAIVEGDEARALASLRGGGLLGMVLHAGDEGA